MQWGNFFHLHGRVFISGGLALAILGAGIVTHERQKPAAAVPKTLAIVPATSADITTRDTDGDGLLDWEEHLYGSDIHKTDTDGDGTGDSEEVRLGRNPIKTNTAKAGDAPNDLLPVAIDPRFATSSADIEGLKKEFFAKFLAADGQNIRETTYRDLIKGFDVKKYSKTYQTINLNITSDNGTDAIRAYGNAFGVLIKKYSVRTHRTEDEILQEAMTSKSNATLRELQLPAIDYRNFAKDLAALRVPSALSAHHLNIVNGYDGMTKGLLGMQNLFANPVDGGGAYQIYTARRLDVTNGYAGVVLYFAKNNVVFGAEEAGYPFYAQSSKLKVGTSSAKTL